MTASLRFRLLLPLIIVGFLVVILVSYISLQKSRATVQDQLDRRTEQLINVLRSPNYPLSPTVLELLAELTDSHLATINDKRQIVDTTLSSLASAPEDGQLINVDGISYRCRSTTLSVNAQTANQVNELVILVNADFLTSQQTQAAFLPIATGIMVLVSLSAVWILLANQVVSRIGKLRERFRTISEGDFEPKDVQLSVSQSFEHLDEIGQLENSAELMAGNLKELWSQVNRQQSERIIHQVAAGMAHQLRNSLTGARIAIELESKAKGNEQSEGLDVALTELEQAESQVKQLLILASGKLVGNAPTAVMECVDKMKKTFRPIAKHRNKDLTWSVFPFETNVNVPQGSTWSAAVSNLIQNALDAGQAVCVEITQEDNDVVTIVRDDGPGVSNTIAKGLFEAFNSTKPEGLGLGLAVAQRAAKTFAGELSYQRQDDITQFRFSCPITH
ncbi:MAG: HAMP domain-containing sensor histidine kinase [Planctomycetota bacterium]